MTGYKLDDGMNHLDGQEDDQDDDQEDGQEDGQDGPLDYHDEEQQARHRCAFNAGRQLGSLLLLLLLLLRK